MKLRMLISAALILICSGCVPYYYNDPYYYGPYGYGPSYPSYYRPPAVYVNPVWGLYYPSLYFDYRYHGHYPGHGGRRY